jgi:hypothetical protein
LKQQKNGEKKLIKIEGTESRIIQNEMLRYRWALLCWVKEGRAELLLYLVELPGREPL